MDASSGRRIRKTEIGIIGCCLLFTIITTAFIRRDVGNAPEGKIIRMDGGLMYEENAGKVLQVRVKGKLVTLGTSLPQLKEVLLKDYSIEPATGKDRPDMIVWSYIEGTYYVFYFSGPPGKEELGHIVVNGGY